MGITDPRPSPKAQQLLDLVIAYRQQHGISPSIRELMTALQLRSPSGIQHRLRSLRSLGLITWHEGCARSLRPTNSHACSMD
jgi:repressor LexA